MARDARACALTLRRRVRPTGTQTERRWPLPPGVAGSAFFSADGRHRYRLERSWDPRRPALTYLLLNPSRATATEDDPTTRKLLHITAVNGGGGYVLVNLFSSVDPRQTRLHLEPSPEELARADRWLRRALSRSSRTVVGWGAGGGAAQDRAARRQAILRREGSIWPMLDGHELWCVGHNRDGSPRHPGRGVRNDVRLCRYVRSDRG